MNKIYQKNQKTKNINSKRKEEFFILNFEHFLIICNFVGTVAFAASGVITGIHKKLDIFGVVLLAIITACGGGIIRDIILNKIPDSFVNPASIYISIATAVVIFIFIKKVTGLIKISWKSQLKIYRLLSLSYLVCDAVGLSAFAVIGASKGIDLKINIITTGILSALTGVGGGIMRDLLVAEVPIVLKEDVYAVLAFSVGAVSHVLIYKLKFLEVPTMTALFLIILIIRLLVIKFKARLPA